MGWVARRMEAAALQLEAGDRHAWGGEVGRWGGANSSGARAVAGVVLARRAAGSQCTLPSRSLRAWRAAARSTPFGPCGTKGKHNMQWQQADWRRLWKWCDLRAALQALGVLATRCTLRAWRAGAAGCTTKANRTRGGIGDGSRATGSQCPATLTTLRAWRAAAGCKKRQKQQ